jgi:hypothetical protein
MTLKVEQPTHYSLLIIDSLLFAYFFAMKQTGILLLGFLIFSCAEKGDPKPAAAAAERPVLVTKDTARRNADSLNPYAPVDRSPMDVAYFPPDYPVQRMLKGTKELPVARVLYSRPHRSGRKIFDSLIHFNESWRLGANEATEIEFFRPVIIQNKRVARGRYMLYAIPRQEQWTLVLNSNLYTWGLNIDSTKDLHRFTVPVQTAPQSVEYFSMVFQPMPEGAALVIAWDNIVARLPFQY